MFNDDSQSEPLSDIVPTSGPTLGAMADILHIESAVNIMLRAYWTITFDKRNINTFMKNIIIKLGSKTQRSI